MSSPFTKVYPSKGDGRVTLDGGLNSKFPRSLIQDNESPDCLNVSFDDGGVGTRDGITKLNTAAIGSYVIDGIYTRRDQDGVSETMVVFAGGSAWDLQSTSFITIGSAQSVFTAGVRVGAAQYENHLFCGNGSVIPYKYDSDFTRHGVYPPVSTHTAATNSNGTLTGDYRYKVSFVNTQVVEGDVGPANSTFTASSEEILVSSIPVAPQSWGVASRKIYRTEAGGSTYKLLTTLENNTATTYVDNSSDSELGANAPTDNGVPPTYSVVCYHQDRLFMDGPQKNYLYYTELANPYVVKALNFRRVGDNTGDLVRGIVSYNNGIVVTGDRTMTFIYMPDTTDSNWINVVMKVPFGSNSPFALIPFNDRLFFPAMQADKFVGIGAILGAMIEPEVTFLTVMTAGGELQSTKIEDQMFDVQSAYVRNISGIAYKNKLYFTVTYGSGQTTNNRIYVLNFELDNLSKVQRAAWVPWSGINAAQMTVYGGNLYMGTADATGFIYKMEDGTNNDDGNAINSYYWTKEFSGFKGDEQRYKDHRFLNILVDQSGNYSMDVLARADSDKGDGDKHVIDLDPAGSEWNTMVWGSDTWGGGVDQKDVKVFLGSLRGQRVQFKFTNQNTADQKFKVYWLKHAYNLKGYR